MKLYEEDDVAIDRRGLRYFELEDAWYVSSLSSSSFTAWLDTLPSVSVHRKFWGGDNPISGYWTEVHARDAERAHRMVRKHFKRETGIDPDEELPLPG